MSSPESAPRFFTATGVFFTVALLLSIGVAAYSYYSVREFQEVETWINTTQSDMQKLEETVGMAKDLAGAARGYALTGQSEYLERYRKASKALPAMMADIRTHPDDNAEQAQREKALWNLLLRRVELAQQQVRQAKPDPTEIFDEGRDLANQIRTKFNEIKGAEERLLEQRSQDSQRRARLTKYAIIGGNLLSCLIMIWVFARLRREMRKRHIAQELAQKSARENGDLNAALRTRAAQLELANKELEGFSYSVSHDLRAPLRVIGGYAMMLEEDYTDKLDDDGKRYLNVIRANTNKMDALIVDLLKLAKSTLAPMTQSVVDMRQMVQKATAEIAIGNNAAITIGRLDDAVANAALLVQVWENLLANAVKFSRNQAHPSVDIRSERNAGEIIYCVEDNGVGMDVSQAPKLFEVFQRFHSQDEFPGTGVGLALVKRIVLRHGGRVWAESRPGAGARFYFSLPSGPSGAASPARDPSLS